MATNLHTAEGGHSIKSRGEDMFAEPEDAVLLHEGVSDMAQSRARSQEMVCTLRQRAGHYGLS